MILQSNVPGRFWKHSRLISNWMGLRMGAGLFWTTMLFMCT